MKILNAYGFFTQRLDDVQIFDLHRKKITSQKVSKLTKKIGEMEFQRDLFFTRWTQLHKETKGIFFDITSFSSYSNMLDIVEWGYNRDGENLPQVNFGMLLGLPSQMPLLYSLYQGSISDVKTIHNISAKLDLLNLKKVTIILDRGFYSQRNIEELYQGFDNFIIPMTFSTLASKNLVERCKNISDSKNLFHINNRAIFYQKFEVEIAELPVYCHIYFDEARRSRELAHLISRLSTVEDLINNLKFDSKEEAENHLKINHDGLKRFFRINESLDHVVIERNHDKITQMINRMGKMILVTKKYMPKEKVLNLYRSRESIEHCFDILKNELNSHRLRVSNRKTLEGRQFLMFLAIIVHTYISNTIKQSKLYKKMTVRGVIKELNKIKRVKMMNERSYITEVSKKQKEIFKCFGLKLPAHL